MEIIRSNLKRAREADYGQKEQYESNKKIAIKKAEYDTVQAKDRHEYQMGSNLNLETTSKATRKKIQKSLYEVGRDSQLQRNILNDPLFFNDPKFRPFVLFKRFGYRQANWIRETLAKEWFEYKNPLDGEGLFQGVMSDEVPQEAVINNGEYDMVNYSLLDVEFKQI